MNKATVVIPNYNGADYIGECLDALMMQNYDKFKITVVDNASSDGSREYIKENYPYVTMIENRQNEGFSAAVNAGIRAADTPYVILLNNDTKVKQGFVEALVKSMEKYPECFSASAKMLQYHDHDRIDNAGDLYCVLGWARARGKDRPAEYYTTGQEIFSACAGAAVYRREVFEKIGYFDERHFAYLEDVDIGYRARIYGYSNRYEPEAEVYHVGSAVSGSRYNAFKVELAAQNSVYLYYKNMRAWQIVLNAPFLFAGWMIKWAFFTRRRLGKVYLKGTKKGIMLCNRKAKVTFCEANRKNYRKIQKELWKNVRILFLKDY